MSEKKKKKEYAIKQFNGDDIFSYAIFRKEDVKGKGKIIMDGDAKPLMSGLSRSEAQYHRKQLER